MGTNPWFMLLLGTGIVLAALIVVAILAKLLGSLLRDRRRVADPAREAAGEGPAGPIVAAPAAQSAFAPPAVIDRKRFDAVVASAIAAYMGGDVAGLRIRSIRQLSAPANDRGGLIAAISASIATAMGTDVRALRILSVKKH